MTYPRESHYWGPVTGTIDWCEVRKFLTKIFKENNLEIQVNYVAAQVILIPIALWLADAVHKVLDEPSGRVANWLLDPKGPPFLRLESPGE